MNLNILFNKLKEKNKGVYLKKWLNNCIGENKPVFSNNFDCLKDIILKEKTEKIKIARTMTLLKCVHFLKEISCNNVKTNCLFNILSDFDDFLNEKYRKKPDSSPYFIVKGFSAYKNYSCVKKGKQIKKKHHADTFSHTLNISHFYRNNCQTKKPEFVDENCDIRNDINREKRVNGILKMIKNEEVNSKMKTKGPFIWLTPFKDIEMLVKNCNENGNIIRDALGLARSEGGYFILLKFSKNYLTFLRKTTFFDSDLSIYYNVTNYKNTVYGIPLKLDTGELSDVREAIHTEVDSWPKQYNKLEVYKLGLYDDFSIENEYVYFMKLLERNWAELVSYSPNIIEFLNIIL